MTRPWCIPCGDCAACRKKKADRATAQKIRRRARTMRSRLLSVRRALLAIDPELDHGPTRAALKHLEAVDKSIREVAKV